MYRPQFAYARSSPEFDDFDFNHYFDFTNVPFLNNTAMPAGALLQNIPLQLQTDFPFYLRGLQVKGGPGTAQPANVSVRLKDPFSRDLSNDFLPLGLYITPSGAVSATTAVIPVTAFRNNPLTVVFEPEVRCPAGSIWWLSIQNPTATTQDLTQVRILFSGVKRRLNGGGGCAS